MSNENCYDSLPWVKNYPKNTSHLLGPLPFDTLPKLITQVCSDFSKNKAFTTCLDNGLSGTLTFRETDQLSNAFAAFLSIELGLKKGDRVAIQMPNCLAYPVAAFGTLKAGCILVNTNPLYTEREMEHQFKDSGAKVLVILDMFADKATTVVPKTQIHTVIVVSIVDLFPLLPKKLVQTILKVKKKIPQVKIHNIGFMDTLRTGQARLVQKPDVIPVNVNSEDIACLQYTGGTTGVSKGAMLTHKNIISNLEQILQYGGEQISRKGDEVMLTALPLYHIFAFTVNCLLFFRVGAHNILIPSPRPVSNLKKAIEKFPITWFTGVNTLLNALANEPWFAANPPKHLKVTGAGGTALLKSTAERWQKVTGQQIVEGYGLTESSPVICFNPLDGRARIESIGLPMPSTEVRCVDEQGNPVSLGEPGELIARGPQIMMGYWQKSEETSQCIKDGWFYTGDVATMDADGFFKIVDRKKDMILVSGFNVYPTEVEDVLCQHPQVLEAAAIAMPDEKTGEAVIVYVVLRQEGSATAEDIRAFCKEKLSGYKVPKKVNFKTELPKTNVGKILRKDIRAEALREL